MTDSVLLFVIGLFMLSLPSGSSFGSLYVSRNLSFLLSYLVFWNIIVHMWSFLFLRYLLRPVFLFFS